MANGVRAGEEQEKHTFTNENQAVTISIKTTMKVDGDSVQVDHQLLVQRLMTAANGLFDDV